MHSHILFPSNGHLSRLPVSTRQITPKQFSWLATQALVLQSQLLCHFSSHCRRFSPLLCDKLVLSSMHALLCRSHLFHCYVHQFALYLKHWNFPTLLISLWFTFFISISFSFWATTTGSLFLFNFRSSSSSSWLFVAAASPLMHIWIRHSRTRHPCPHRQSRGVIYTSFPVLSHLTSPEAPLSPSFGNSAGPIPHHVLYCFLTGGNKLPKYT